MHTSQGYVRKTESSLGTSKRGFYLKKKIEDYTISEGPGKQRREKTLLGCMKFRNVYTVLKCVLRISALCSTRVGGSQEDAWKSWHGCPDLCHLQMLMHPSGAAAEEEWLQISTQCLL